jgi:cobalt-zinc-cadmium efflux system membrane fusion protein
MNKTRGITIAVAVVAIIGLGSVAVGGKMPPVVAEVQAAGDGHDKESGDAHGEDGHDKDEHGAAGEKETGHGEKEHSDEGHGKEGHTEAASEGAHEEEGHLELTAEQITAAGIEVVAAAPRQMSTSVT